MDVPVRLEMCGYNTSNTLAYLRQGTDKDKKVLCPFCSQGFFTNGQCLP